MRKNVYKSLYLLDLIVILRVHIYIRTILQRGWKLVFLCLCLFLSTRRIGAYSYICICVRLWKLSHSSKLQRSTTVRSWALSNVAYTIEYTLWIRSTFVPILHELPENWIEKLSQTAQVLLLWRRTLAWRKETAFDCIFLYVRCWFISILIAL